MRPHRRRRDRRGRLTPRRNCHPAGEYRIPALGRAAESLAIPPHNAIARARTRTGLKLVMQDCPVGFRVEKVLLRAAEQRRVAMDHTRPGGADGADARADAASGVRSLWAACIAGGHRRSSNDELDGSWGGHTEHRSGLHRATLFPLPANFRVSLMCRIRYRA